ncbi:MAG: hypothetical protein A3K03_01375 [Bdellovibrionales bacterium RIFOXYD1_FULL_44_7]|nr:MAG: hypothetical protein A3K03_01375 [Bdellovibrionales bacterium RIFOXYD1_FULL_44_7]
MKHANSRVVKPVIIDAHCHLADSRFLSSLNEVIERAHAAGIGKFIQGGVDPADWQRQLLLRKTMGTALVPVFGIHPWVIAGITTDVDGDNLAEAISLLRGLAAESAAIGEIGIDLGSERLVKQKQKQEEYFLKQLDLADEFRKPIVLHVVKAHNHVIRLLKQSGVNRRGIVHSFCGSVIETKEYLALGLCLSVGSSILRKKDDYLHSLIETIPEDRLVIESDAPDQAPPDWSKKYNEPCSIWRVAEKVASFRKNAAETVLKISSENLETIFDIR